MSVRRKTRKIKLTVEEFNQFITFNKLLSLKYSRTFNNQINQRKFQYFREMGKKYDFDIRRAKLYSDGVIEVV